MTVLPEFRAQLHTAAQQRARSRRHRALSRFSIDGRMRRFAASVPVLLSVLLAIAIAVVAIATLGHRHGATIARTPSASSRNALLQILGVLRRPQTGADVLSTRARGVGGAAPGGLFGLSPSAQAAWCRSPNRAAMPCALELDRPLVRTVRAAGG